MLGFSAVVQRVCRRLRPAADRRTSICWGAVLGILWFGVSAGRAENVAEAVDADTRETSATSASTREPDRVFDQLLVTGGEEHVDSIPGSADFIGLQDLEKQDYTDVHRVLRQVPGVNIQEEDGYGLRPNIGMRGTGVERSQKITLLEDGVLIAPAPYAAPAAYYVPNSGRMEAMEVRKGSAAITQGPYTTGGVINFVSTAIPSRTGGSIDLAVGSEATAKLHAHAGGSSERWGWLLETFQLDTDGFKDLDGGGSTGVRLQDYLGKVRFSSRSDASVFQLVDLKLGHQGQFGEETYLGLTDEDFDISPYRRYAGSQEDWIDTDHDQAQLRYFVQPGSRVTVTAMLYRNEFFRNWHKLQSVGGVGIGDVLAGPSSFEGELAILRGEVDSPTGSLKIRNNRRNYLAQGIEAITEWRPTSAHAEHRFALGIRWHEDEEDRFQEEDLWSMRDGRMELDSLGMPGSQSNRIDAAEAVSFFVNDSILFGRWTIAPGVRFESIDFRRSDYGKLDPDRTGAELEQQANGVDEVLPGVGISYALSSTWSLFGGVHRGFAPPGPGQDPQTESEESWNYESGFRFQRQATSAKAVAFFSDYDNLLGRDTLSSGGEGTGDAFNGGAVEVRGLELSVRHELGRRTGGSLRVPLQLSYTYTVGEFLTSFETDFADWAPAVEAGDELPYLPEHQVNVGVGFVDSRWGLYLDFAYADRMRTSPGQSAIPFGEGTDAYTVVDVAVDYRLLSNLRLRAQVRNAFDDAYLAARRPAGARPGRPRALLVGLNWDF